MDSKRILLVDDDTIAATRLKKRLEEEGYIVSYVSSGEEALEFCKTSMNTIDLILMDIDLGSEMDGTIVAQEILNIQNIPLIFISFYTDRETVKKIEMITSYGFVPKNSDMIVLVTSIKMAFKLFEMNQKVIAAKDKLADKERFAKIVTNHIPAMIGYWTKDLICTFANPAYLNWFAKSPEQILGIKMQDLMSEELYQKNQPHVRSVLEGNEQKFERTLVKQNGELTHLFVNYIADRVDGAVNGFYVLVTDVTEIKKQQESLQESEQKWRRLFEVLPVGISLLGANHTVSEFNSTLTQILDITPEGMREGKYNSRKYYDMNGNVILPEQFPSIRAIKEQRTISSFEMMFEKENEKTVWVEVTAAPMQLKDFDCVVVTSDVTKRKEAEEQLRKLSRAIEQSESSIFITNRAGNIEYVNRKGIEISGYSREELIGKNPRILQSGKTPKEEYQKLWKTILAKGEWIGEFQNKKKNGEIYWESVHISAILNEIGDITNFLAVKEDITYKKSMEEQLKQSQKLESLGQISGGIAHDFNNILAILMGNLELIARKTPADNPSLLKKIEASLSAVDRGAQLTKKLLAFARKQVFSKEIVDLNSVIQEMFDVLERVLGKQIKIQLEISESPLIISIDKNEMENVILNLAINARDAMDNVGTLTIRTREVKNIILPLEEKVNYENKFAEFSIMDTGSGIPAHLLQKIFEPFFTTKAKGKGIGLGLSLTYGFVKQSGGQIHVYSEEGKGTCFRLYFPFLENNLDNENNSKARILELEPKINNEIKNKTIMIVDDETAMLNIATSILSEIGYSVVTSGNALDAIAILNRQPIDLVISDIIMPGEMNGIALAKNIKEKFTHIKIILTSGFPGHLHRMEVEELRQYAFIEKPYKMKDLENLVLRVINDPI